MLRSVSILFLAGVAALAQTPASPGQRIFRAHCSYCHGTGGEGGRAPDLTVTAGRMADPDAELYRIIANGIPGSEMAAYSGQLSEGDLRLVVAFLRSIGKNDSPVPGDPGAGEATFWGKGGCGNCHAVGNRGNRVGPDLSRIGRLRNVAFLRESLVTPSANVARGFESATVVTREGTTVRGIAKVVDDFSAVLVDFNGKVHSFDRAAVSSVTRDTASLMPEYGKTLTPAELTNVVAYLATLRPKEPRP
jgi:putative heme-binding domain-containing protein